MFGKLINYTEGRQGIIISFVGGQIIMKVILPGIVNFFASVGGQPRFSTVIDNLNAEDCTFTVTQKQDRIQVITDLLRIEISDDFKVDIYDRQGTALCQDYRGARAPFVRRGGNWAVAAEEGHQLAVDYGVCKLEIIKKLDGNTFFYGLGEKTGHLNKRGYHYKMWNTDNPKPHVESFDTLYKSIPFFIGLKDKQAFGIFFDNTFETHFDMGKENGEYYYFGAVDGNLDYYFIFGPEMKEVVAGYTRLTGRTPLPQRWALGYQQCRWAYVPEDRLMEIAGNFRKKKIPCDVLYLDIDYMDAYRVFTWDKEKFPKPEQMLSRLKAQGFKVVTIIDPGVKKDKGYSVYEEGLARNYFITDKDGIPYVNKVWPGDSLYPDFTNAATRKWWAEKQKLMVDYGVDGIWNDMNEPASFQGPLPDDVLFDNDGVPAEHREVHNVYGHYMAKATYEGLKEYTDKRPFIVTRACFAGTQKYASVWTGDNFSFWEHLRMSIPMLMNLSISGMSFCGTDVGGFSFDCTAELLSRWVQVGCFTPLFRNHSSIMTRDQEPWAFDERTEEINRKYINLRYRLIPYLYDLFWHGEESGLPVIRPLVMHYQEDECTYEMNDQFLCGENILVAPVAEQGKTARMVYLPAGDSWVDYWTKEVMAGGQYVVKEAPLDICPVYIKQGSIVPNYPVQNYLGEKIIEQLILDLYPGNLATRYIHYQDDGESFAYKNGTYNSYGFSMSSEKNKALIQIDIDKLHSGYEQVYRGFVLKINNVKPAEIIVDGTPVLFEIEKNAVRAEIGGNAAQILVKL